MEQLILLHREAKIHSIAAHPHETRVAAGEEMNFDFALPRLRGFQTQLKSDGSSLHRRATG